MNSGRDKDGGADCAVQDTFFCFSCSACHSMQPGAHMVAVGCGLANLAPEETVKLLGVLFSQFDSLAIHHGLETIKTIGDG
jgi:hypothetical protein